MNLDLRLVTQKNKWYCGPASVKRVLDSYGIVKSQEELVDYSVRPKKTVVI